AGFKAVLILAARGHGEAQPAHRFFASSSAALTPRSEKVSFVWVPRPERPVRTAEAPDFRAAMILVSSSFDPDQAHSPSVKSSNVVPPMSSETVEPLAKG